MPKSHPTIYDVAALSGVSKSTVSRVLQDDARVSTDTRQKVQSAIQTLGYVPASAARSLSSHRSTSVGLLIRNIDSPLYANLNALVQRRLQSRGFQVIQESVTGVHPVSYESELLKHLLGLHPQGILVASGTFPSELITSIKSPIPIVMVGHPEDDPTLHNVSYDQHHAGRAIVDFLAERGHRDLIVQTIPKDFSRGSFIRVSALLDHAHELGFKVTTYDVSSTINYSDFVNRVIRGGTSTAVCCLYDRYALDLWSVLKREGIEVGKDISVIGTDGVNPALNLLGLATFRLPVEKVAERATDVMINLIESETENPPVVRESIRGWIQPGDSVANLTQAPYRQPGCE